MAAVDMSIRSTLLERFRRLDPGLVQVKVILAVALLGFIAVLAVAVPAVLLARYDGHPMSQVWIMAVTICAYVFLLLQCIWRSWPFYTDLARLSYGLLLASSAASEFGPRAAILALHLTTVYAAAYFGYALALHRLGAGTERAIRGGALPLPHPTCRTRAQARSATRTLALTALGVMAVWTAFLYLITSVGGMPDELDTMSVLSFMGWMHAVLWVITVGMVLLRGALFPAWMEPATFLFMVCGAVVSLATRAVAGAVGAAVLQLLLLTALAALSGYCLAVYITYLHVATAADAAAADDVIVDHHGGGEMVIQQEELPLEHGK